MKTHRLNFMLILLVAILLPAAPARSQSVAPDGTWLSPREAVARPVGQTVRVRTGPFSLGGGSNTGTVSGVLALLDPAALQREQTLRAMRERNPRREYFGRYTATVQARPNGDRYLHFHRSAGTSTD